ncbi:MAG: hypothetical protein ACO1SV_20670 [Fimbriimonas sp.]
MRTRHRESEETTRLAVEMYTRDQEALHHRLATEAALEEAEVPSEYLRRAKEELANREFEKKRRRQIAGAIGAALVPVAALVAFIALRPPSAPIQEGFGTAPHLRWTLEMNEGSQGSVRFEEGRATIKVDRFAPSPTRLPGKHWVTLRSIDGDKNLRTLNTLSFRARGEGLSRIRFRFVRGNRSWITPSYEVTSKWETISVPLDRLGQTKRKGDTETWDGAFNDRPRSIVSEIQIQTGSNVNSVDAKGTLEVDDIEIK